MHTCRSPCAEGGGRCRQSVRGPPPADTAARTPSWDAFVEALEAELEKDGIRVRPRRQGGAGAPGGGLKGSELREVLQKVCHAALIGMIFVYFVLAVGVEADLALTIQRVVHDGEAYVVVRNPRHLDDRSL